MRRPRAKPQSCGSQLCVTVWVTQPVCISPVKYRRIIYLASCENWLSSETCPAKPPAWLAAGSPGRRPYAGLGSCSLLPEITVLSALFTSGFPFPHRLKGILEAWSCTAAVPSHNMSLPLGPNSPEQRPSTVREQKPGSGAGQGTWGWSPRTTLRQGPWVCLVELQS